MQQTTQTNVGIFGKTDRFYTHIPQLGRVRIPAQVLWLMGGYTFCFFSLAILSRIFGEQTATITSYMVMPTDVSVFLQKPWTWLTAMFVNRSLIIFLGNFLGILIFGNLVTVLISQRVVLPIFFAGCITSFIALWMFKAFPLTRPLLSDHTVFGVSGGTMALAMVSTFYMPEQMVRLYGLYPLKLKFIGRGILLFSVLCLFIKYNYLNHFLILGGALAGYATMVYIKRKNILLTKEILKESKKIRFSAEMEIGGDYPSPKQNISTTSETTISRKEYLDRLLDKIGRYGIESLSRTEMEFLEKYSKE